MKTGNNPSPESKHSEVSRRPSLFINCPYDTEFLPMLDAIVFTSVCCGFEPRSARESGAISIARILRIKDSLQGSQYSIHDLSRCQGNGPDNLARFNMPLELGMAMQLGFSTNHDWAVLVPRHHPYAQYVSDLGAYDLLKHDGTQADLVPTLMGWLTTRQNSATRKTTPMRVLQYLPLFELELDTLRQQWRGNEAWSATVDKAHQVARRNGLVPTKSRR
jgi:hypothetical protein